MTETKTLDRKLAIRERWRLFLDRGVLALFLVAGSLLVIGLKQAALPLPIRIGVPIALILLYAALTLSRTRFRLRYDQAGDNCYYMGFIFTLVSLGVALYQIQTDLGMQEYGISIVKDFGLALSTTITGIICRVSLSQLREDAHDIEEASRRELIEHSRALSGQLRASVSMIAELRQQTEERLKNYVFEMAQVVKEHEARAVDLKNSTSKLVESVKELAADLASSAIPTGKLREETAQTLNAISLLTETLQRANTALSQIEVATGRVTDSYDKTSTAGLNVAAHETKVAESMAAGAIAVRQLSEATVKLNESLHLASSGAQAYKAMADEVRNVTEALKSAARSVASSNSSLSAAGASLATQFETVERLARSLGEQAQALAVSHARLQQADTQPAAVAAQ